MSKCRECPVATGTTCYGETFPIRCDRADYRALYLRISTEPPEAIESHPDPDQATLVSDLRRLARMGGCLYREPCGCRSPTCLMYGGEAPPSRCVKCLTGARKLEAPPETP